MNKKLVMAMGLLLSLQAFAHGDLAPAHGGLIKEGKSMTVELLAGPDMTMVYLSDHASPVVVQGASGELVLLSGGKKSVIPLAPAGGNALMGPGIQAAKGAKAVVKLSVPARGEEQLRFLLP